jgi:hypothetical protein
MNRGVVIVLVVLALLFIGGQHRDKAEAAPPPPPAPAAVEYAVPLSVSETTTPDPPDTAEEQIVAWFVERTTGWGWNVGGIVIAFLILAALVVALERTRAQHQ